MQTREKFGTQAKKMLKILYDMKEIQAYSLLTICKDQIMTDIKKLIDLLFIFEGLGFITRISKKNFIYSGLKGMLNRLIETTQSAITRTQNDREHWLFAEDYVFEGRRYPLRQSVYYGLFYQEILGLLFTQPSRSVSRDTIEKVLEQISYYFQSKDLNSTLIFNEMASLMTSLNLLDKRNSPDIKMESFESYQWIGPDLMRPIIIDQYNPYALNLKEILIEKCILTYEKELQFFSTLFSENMETEPIVQNNNSLQPIQYSSSLFPTCAYALIKGRHITYFMKKLAIIIGRQNNTKNQKYQWDVDLVLDQSNKVSKQHALIRYNNDCFEILCLSKNKSIIVDSTLLSIKDPPLQLKNKSLIQIGKKTLSFYLPKGEQQEANEIE